MHMAGWKAKYTSHSTFTMRANCSHDHPEQSTLEQLQASISGQEGLQTRHPWWAHERANTNVSQTLRLPPAGLRQSAAQLSHCQNKSSKWLNVYSSSWLGCAIHHLFRLTPSCFFLILLLPLRCFVTLKENHISQGSVLRGLTVK